MGTIGIDLGTYNTCVAFVDSGGTPHIVTGRQGPTDEGPVFPSFIQYALDGRPLAWGKEARQAIEETPAQVVWGTKRLIGRPYDALSDQLERFRYPTRKGLDGGVLVGIGPGGLRPQMVATELLRWVKKETEAYCPPLSGRADGAVVTHPAYFNAQQVRATREAAEATEAGFATVELISEPIAAALAYGYGGGAKDKRESIMIIDCGAGTLDIVVGLLTRSGRKIDFDETLAARGNVALGGIDMDDRLLAAVRVRHQLLQLTPRDEVALRNIVQRLKHRLSKVPKSQDFAAVDGKALDVTLVRRDAPGAREPNWIVLEDEIDDVLAKFRAEVSFARAKSGMPTTDFDHVVLIGGPMNMRCMRGIVRDVFADNRKICRELDAIDSKGFPVDPMTAVAVGAAVYGAELTKVQVVLNRDYGFLCDRQGEVLLRRGDLLPAKAEVNYSLRGIGVPGTKVSIGLYVREELPDHPARWTRYGEYSFAPVFGTDGYSNYSPGLQADKNGDVTLLFHDFLSERTLELARLGALEETEIDCPQPFQYGRKGGGHHEVSHSVDESRVREERALGETVLGTACAKRAHPSIKAEAALRTDLERRIDSLTHALAALPKEGSASQTVFQECSFATEQLRHFLATALRRS